MSEFENEITIEDVVDSFSARLDNGERPSIEEYKNRYPQLADRIEAILPALVVLENVDSDPGDRKLVVDDSIPEVLAEYQIVQEIGRGGMGIVFEARHSTMRRRVALKVLPKSSAEKPNYLRRFLTEARSAGQLHHTNIVPVFEVGESDGLNYYSMQYIHGDNLDHVIADVRRLRQPDHDEPRWTKGISHSQRSNARSQLIAESMVLSEFSGKSLARARANPGDGLMEQSTVVPASVNGANGGGDRINQTRATAFTQPCSNGHRDRSHYHNRVAAVGIQVAEALAHAHEHGVLHRDVKPANLILDTDGKVWITDFGLAKLDAHDLTQTGDIIGTLRYMAPERFAGHADPRSDIYSLGLTLYELATLKCAFENDRGTLFQDVANSSSVISPRKVDETIPSDLETIILKSIEPQPDRRYQTAGEMADDLQLFLADRPIRARRTTWAEKCWRVARRNPVASTLSICLVILLVVITAGSIQFARTESKNRRESQKNLFYSKIDQAKMRRFSGRPGQRYEAVRAIRDAVSLLPEMDLNDAQIRDIQFLLRSEVFGALSLTDIDREWSYQFPSGWGGSMRFAIDPTGEYFAEGHDEGRIRIRKIADQSKTLELPGGKGKDPPWMMRFCPNGKFLVAKYHQPNVHNEFLTVVWDLSNGGQKCYVTRYSLEFCFSEDSSRIAISYHDRAEVIDLKTRTLLKTIYPEFTAEGNASQIRLSSDSHSVAISRAASGIVEFWDIKRQPVLTNVIDCEENVFCMDWDSDRGIFVAGCHQGSLVYWMGELSRTSNEIQLHQNSIHEIHLHKDRELVATTAWDATTRFTDLVAGREVMTVENHKLGHNGFCKTGRLGMLDNDKRLGVWRVSLPMIQTYSTPNEQRGGFTCCIHPEFKKIVGRTVGSDVELWDIEKRRRLLTLEDNKAVSISFSASGNHLFTSGDTGFRRWPVDCDGKNFRLGDPTALIDSKSGHFDLFDEESRVVVGVGNRIKVINLDTGIVEDVGRHGNLNQVRLTANDRYALTGTWHGKGVKIWDMNTGECVQTVTPDISSVSPLEHPTDPSRFFLGRRNNSEYSLEDTSDPKGPARLKQRFEHDGSICLVNDHEHVLVQTNSFNMLWIDLKTQEELAKLVSSGQSRIIDRCVSTDGKTLVLACFDNLQIVDLEEYQNTLTALGIAW